MSTRFIPKPTQPSACEPLLDACTYLNIAVSDLAEQALLNCDDRVEVLAKLDGIAEAITETRARYLAVLHEAPEAGIEALLPPPAKDEEVSNVV